MNDSINKYPRTKHIQGSRLQKGDHDLSQVQFSELAGLHFVIEEKVDGANAGISFDASGKMHLQSRGHYLVGGPREKQWDLFKRWAAAHEDSFLEVLEDRYIMYGEWLYAKHTVFYDMLPHYFMEFDIFDKQTGTFLSTPARRNLLMKSPVVSVLVLHEGPVETKEELERYVTHSYFKTGNWNFNLLKSAANAGYDIELASKQTDSSDLMEGLYIKIEKDGIVTDRLKWVRNSFVNAIADSGDHWADRTIIPNVLAPGVDIFAW